MGYPPHHPLSVPAYLMWRYIRCPKCGAVVGRENETCPKCGAKLR
jgi:rRNA maturation endonuclease Nob1